MENLYTFLTAKNPYVHAKKFSENYPQLEHAPAKRFA
jgi:hypothetical protein